MGNSTSLSVTDITILITILVICIIGIIFNLLCLGVLFRQRMKSSFNTVLLGLTCFDLLLLLKSVFTTLNKLTGFTWSLNQSQWAPKTLFFLSWLCDGGTKYFIVAVSLERYIAICHPLKARSWLTHRRSRIFAFCVAAYVALLATANFIFVHYSEVLSRRQLEVEKAVLLNFGPFLAICFLNVMIYIEIKKSQSLKRSELKPSPDQSAVTRMLFTVVLVFGFCYSFEFIRRIMSYFVVLDFENNNLHFIINLLADIFYVFNSSVNFVIYYLLGRKFRSEFLSMYKGFCIFTKSRYVNNGKGYAQESQTESSNTSRSTLELSTDSTIIKKPNV